MKKRPKAKTARLTDVLVHDADDQRRRLARLLHDGPSQTVSAAAMNLELVDAAGLGPSARDALANARQQLQDSATELSRLAYDQHPPFLGEGGLFNAALILARRSGERLALQLDVPTPMPALGLTVELTAYRLLEASLAGVFVNTHPVVADLSLEQGRLSLALTGKAAAGAPASIQLQLFRHRAGLGGGRLAISRKANRKGGTQLRLVVRFLVPRTTRKTGVANKR